MRVRTCANVREGVRACASGCVSMYEHIISTSERLISTLLVHVSECERIISE